MTDLITVDADRALLHLLGEGARDVERDVGFEQRAPHLAQRRVDIGLRQRAAPGQPVEDPLQAVRKDCRTSLPFASPRKGRSGEQHFDARGRIALSGGGLRPRGPVGGSEFTVSCESGRKIGADRLPSTAALIAGRSGRRATQPLYPVREPTLAACRAITTARSRIISTASAFSIADGAPPKQPARSAALAGRSALARHQGEMAGLGAVALCRPAAGAGRGRGLAHLLCRARELADPDRRPQHPARSGVVEARLAVPLRRTEAGQRSRHRLCRPAADRCRAGVARPLRSSRCRDAVAACRRAPPARRHAARQRHHHAQPRSGDRGRSV